MPCRELLTSARVIRTGRGPKSPRAWWEFIECEDGATLPPLSHDEKKYFDARTKHEIYLYHNLGWQEVIAERLHSLIAERLQSVLIMPEELREDTDFVHLHAEVAEDG